MDIGKQRRIIVVEPLTIPAPAPDLAEVLVPAAEGREVPADGVEEPRPDPVITAAGDGSAG